MLRRVNLGWPRRIRRKHVAAAFRTSLLQTVRADGISGGAIAAPLVTPGGCVGVMAAEGVQHGVFVTTGTFTDEARQFAEGKNQELVDAEAVISFIGKLPSERQARLFETVFSGDYSTPTCPNCDVKMVLRTTRKGPSAGSDFWGCPNHPRCRQTFDLRRDPADLLDV